MRNLFRREKPKNLSPDDLRQMIDARNRAAEDRIINACLSCLREGRYKVRGSELVIRLVREFPTHRADQKALNINRIAQEIGLHGYHSVTIESNATGGFIWCYELLVKITP